MKRIALALATIFALALPTQAQTFSFGIHGDGFGFSIGSGATQFHPRPLPRHERPRSPDIRHCMHLGAVVELVRSQGYRNARIYDDRGPFVRVKAERRGRDHIVSVDACRARIVNVAPIHDRGGWGRR